MLRSPTCGTSLHWSVRKEEPDMGQVMFMRKGEVHTAPAAPVYLTDGSGNLVTASVDDGEDEARTTAHFSMRGRC